ncbi:Rpn family recombination-promoting nuclease/putative transposase [Desulfonatronovibrio magnus]|uniref:Rpn family recombination-promoting nuclease/putative transposase n=1 Tax=Desulfonatronovibrio magnus TaxID=698827 RepID=UPI0005EB9C94|nr:Rpn family recombination-promoting nuclease/putative transposase [Desulfonatronovibrio magnus]
MSFEIPSPHDVGFKTFFQDEELVRDFIKYYIPDEIKAYLDLSVIEIDISGFVAEEFKEFLTDVVVRVRLKNSDEMVELYFLFEHKSYLDRYALLQALHYSVQKWMNLYRRNKLAGYLPIVIPVIIYHGISKWNFSHNFEDYFDIPHESFRVFIPKFRHLLHDITHMGDEAFKTSILMEIFHLLFKYIHFPELDIKLQEIFDLLEQLPDEDKRKEYLFNILKYVLASGSLSEEQVTEHTRRFPGGKDMVGVAMQEIEKRVEQSRRPYWEGVGEQRGETKKARDSIFKLVNSKFGILQPEIVNRIKTIQSLEILDALFDYSLRAETMEQFTDQVRKITDN